MMNETLNKTVFDERDESSGEGVEERAHDKMQGRQPNGISLADTSAVFHNFNTTCPPEFWLRNLNVTLPANGPSLLPSDLNQTALLPDPCILTDEEREQMQKARRKADAYKTALCNAYRQSGRCFFGEKCRFAHGVEELRLPAQPRGRMHPKYKTVLCDKFSTTGFCHYGSRCQFIHKFAHPAMQELRSAATALLSAQPQPPRTFSALQPPSSQAYPSVRLSSTSLSHASTHSSNDLYEDNGGNISARPPSKEMSTNANCTKTQTMGEIPSEHLKGILSKFGINSNALTQHNGQQNTNLNYTLAEATPTRPPNPTRSVRFNSTYVTVPVSLSANGLSFPEPN